MWYEVVYFFLVGVFPVSVALFSDYPPSLLALSIDVRYATNSIAYLVLPGCINVIAMRTLKMRLGKEQATTSLCAAGAAVLTYFVLLEAHPNIGPLRGLLAYAWLLFSVPCLFTLIRTISYVELRFSPATWRLGKWLIRIIAILMMLGFVIRF